MKTSIKTAIKDASQRRESIIISCERELTRWSKETKGVEHLVGGSTICVDCWKFYFGSSLVRRSGVHCPHTPGDYDLPDLMSLFLAIEKAREKLVSELYAV